MRGQKSGLIADIGGDRKFFIGMTLVGNGEITAINSVMRRRERVNG